VVPSGIVEELDLDLRDTTTGASAAEDLDDLDALLNVLTEGGSSSVGGSGGLSSSLGVLVSLKRWSANTKAHQKLEILNATGITSSKLGERKSSQGPRERKKIKRGTMMESMANWERRSTILDSRLCD